MNWQPIDFQSIVSLDSVIVPLLENFLDGKERTLAETIQLTLLPQSKKAGLPQEPSLSLLLIDLERFLLSSPKEYRTNFEEALAKINEEIWFYIETLEGTIIELAQQVESTSLEQWHERLSNVVTELKDFLLIKLRNLILFIQKLETLLWRFKQLKSSSQGRTYYFQRLSMLWSTLLDKEFLTALTKNETFLQMLYEKFIKRYQSYLQLQTEVTPHLDKLNGYKMLHLLGRSTEQQIIKLYMLLKLWELNRNTRSLRSKEFTIALRNFLSVDKAIELLKDYYHSLKSKLFERSLAIKHQSPDILNDEQDKEAIISGLIGYQNESLFLTLLIQQYREFLLRIDPDPYVRTRVGFSEPTATTEPSHTQPLLGLSYDAESLSDSYKKLIEAVSKASPEQFALSESLHKEIQSKLHELANPLASARSQRNRMQQLLDKLKEMDELGSLNPKTIDYSGRTLSKLMRADWRHHICFGIPLFHYLYNIHKGLVHPIASRTHINRMTKFSQLIDRFKEWMKPQNMQLHAHEIELSIHDLKAYLQDFLGSVQHAVSDGGLMGNHEKAFLFYQETAQQLLEYRYLFGNFFYHLRQNEEFGTYLRRQFLFVDQYFESIEQKLHELKE